MRLIIVRHGETEDNKKGIRQGHTPGKLSKKGISQSKKVGKRLSKESFDIIYCSDLRRAKQTLKEIKRHHPKIKAIYTAALRERCYGRFDGRPRTDLKEFLEKKGITVHQLKGKGIETSGQKDRRVMNFYRNMLKRHPDCTILWVTHAGPIYTILMELLGITSAQAVAINPQNTSVTIIEVDKEKNHKVHLANCIKHL